MAEFIIGAVALGVASPAVVISFAQCGAYFNERISKLKNVPFLVQDMARFGSGLHSGRIKHNISLASWAYGQENISSELKDTLEDQIIRLKEALIQADKVLQRSFDERGQVKRGYFFMQGERKLKRILKNLDKWQNDFWISISLIDMQRRLLPDPLLLSSKIFEVHPQTYLQNLFQPDQSQHIHVAKGQMFQGAVREVTVLIEKSPRGDVVSVKDIATYLASTSSSRGILKCLGYRDTSEPELVFEIVEDFTEMQTLQNLIAADQSLGYGGARPLDYRFQLSRRIAEAVLSVHALKRVHKNIRPNNILLLKSNDADETQIGSPFLIDWTMLRSTDMPSSMVGDHDWLKNIYRHPRRQGLQPEQRYNMGHDIYSLGVCMLEIGLWEPLIVERDGHCMLNTRYGRLAVDIGAVKAEDIANLKALTRPLVVQRVFVALTRKELPSRMGIAYTELVTSCLTCLEGGSFGDAFRRKQNCDGSQIQGLGPGATFVPFLERWKHYDSKGLFIYSLIREVGRVDNLIEPTCSIRLSTYLTWTTRQKFQSSAPFPSSIVPLRPILANIPLRSRCQIPSSYHSHDRIPINAGLSHMPILPTIKSVL